MRSRHLVLALIIAAAATSCDDDGVDDTTGEFLFALRGMSDQFVAVTSDPVVLEKARAQLQLPVSQRDLFINGPIARGNGGHNVDWSWHFVPDEWDLVEAAIEVCDGRPQLVEDDLDYWIDEVGQYCPWSSYVAAEL